MTAYFSLRRLTVHRANSVTWGHIQRQFSSMSQTKWMLNALRVSAKDNHIVLCKIWSFQECRCWGWSLGPMPLWMVYIMIQFYREVLAPHPTPIMEHHPMSAVYNHLFKMFSATHHIGDRSSICNQRTHHTMVTGTHLCSRCRNELSGSINCWEFLDQLWTS
jgi:hypothetical protein